MVARLSPDDATQLAWQIEASTGFSLFFVVVPGPPSSKAVLRQLRQILAAEPQSITLRRDTEPTTQLSQLVPPTVPLFVFGLESQLSHELKAIHGDLIQDLNWRRGRIVDLGCPVVFFVSAYGLAKIANLAPDFYDFRTSTYTAELAPDPRFWFFEHVSISPQESNRVQVQSILLNLRLEKLAGENETLSATVAQREYLSDRIQAQLALRDADGARETLAALSKIPTPTLAFDQSLLVLQGRLAELEQEYEVAKTFYEGATGLSPMQRSYRVAKALWHLERDREAYDLLTHAPGEMSAEIIQFRGMVEETIGGAGRMALASFRESTRNSPTDSILEFSGLYHAARLRMSMGDVTSGLSEAESLLERARFALGADHDGTGFVELLVARGKWTVGIKGAMSGVGRALAKIVNRRGIEDETTLDAVVQVRELRQDPVKLIRSEFGPEAEELALEAWGSERQGSDKS
jgi:hypothetical protein